MKTVERILIKIVVIQFVFLFLTQFLFHYLNVFPPLGQLTKYEGVMKKTYMETLQVFLQH